MKVTVERCWRGGDTHVFRLTFKGGAREFIRGDTWDRKVASEALDIAENLYHLPRKQVRFRHLN